jgi:hypothetical protein
MPSAAIDLIDFHVVVQRHRRELDDQAGAQRLSHDLHLGHAKGEFRRDLPVGPVEAHDVQAQYPGPQRPRLTSETRISHVVDAGVTVFAAIALPVQSSVPGTALQRFQGQKIESFFGSMKTELDINQPYARRADAKRDLFAYIEAYYNRARLHSTLGYITPEQAELQRA